MKNAVPHPAYTAVAMHQHLGAQSQSARFDRKGPQLFDRVYLGAGHDLRCAELFVAFHLSRGLDVAPHARVNRQFGEIVAHKLHDPRGLHDDTFGAPGSIFADLGQDNHPFFGRDFRIDGNSNLSAQPPPDPDCILHLGVLEFPRAFAATESLRPDIHGIGPACENGLNHFQAAARSQ